MPVTPKGNIATPRAAVAKTRPQASMWKAKADLKAKTKAKARPRSHSSLMDDEVALRQGLTLVHFSAQLERILWDRGAFRGCLEGVWQVSGGFKEHEGMSMVYFVSETAQVELRSGRM